LSIYKKLFEKHQSDVKQLNSKYNLISGFRFLSIVMLLVALYLYYKSSQSYWLVLLAIAGIVFFVLLRIHQKLARSLQLKKALLKINENELAFLNKGSLESIPFDNGADFETHQHFYTYDLDVFDEAGLFQHLNRTATYIGSKTLADLLQNPLEKHEILRNQQAVKELSEKLEWRQKLFATASLLEDKKETYDQLINWSKTVSPLLPKFYMILAWLLRAIMVALIALMFITANVLYLNLSLLLFVINLGVVFSNQKKIRAEIVYFNGIDKITRQYGFIIKQIESTEFESPKLKDLKQKLAHQGIPVSKRIQKLSGLIAAMDAVQNLLVAILFNGFFLFHIQVLNNLLKWKQTNAADIKNWLSVIGAFE